MGHKGPSLLLAVLIAIIFASHSFAEGLVMSHHIAVSSDYEDNVYEAVENEKGDEVGRLFYDFELHWPITTNNLWDTDYQLGLKKYLHYDDLDAMINQIALGYTYKGLESYYFKGDSTFKLRNTRNGLQDYNKLILGTTVGKEFQEQVTLEARAEYTRFDFKDYNYFDYWQRKGGVSLDKVFAKYLSSEISYFLTEKHFTFNAYRNAGFTSYGPILEESNHLRRDTIHEVTANMNISYWLLAKFEYTFGINESNSYGDTYYTHRFIIAASKEIFKDTDIHLLGVFQFHSSSQALLIPHSNAIEEEDENYNQATARLTHAFKDWVSLEAGYSRYWSLYSAQKFNFAKNVYSIGVSFKF